MATSDDWYEEFVTWVVRCRHFRPTPEQAAYLNTNSATFPEKTNDWEQRRAWPILAMLFHHGPVPRSALLVIGALEEDLAYLAHANHIQAYVKGGEQWYKLTPSAYTYWFSPPWPYRPYEI